jgi:hypothetical protein
MRPPPNQRQTSGQFCCYRGGIEASAVKEAGGASGIASQRQPNTAFTWGCGCEFEPAIQILTEPAGSEHHGLESKFLTGLHR